MISDIPVSRRSALQPARLVDLPSTAWARGPQHMPWAPRRLAEYVANGLGVHETDLQIYSDKTGARTAIMVRRSADMSLGTDSTRWVLVESSTDMSRALRVSAVRRILVCGNGLVTPAATSELRRQHRGNDPDTMVQWLGAALRAADREDPYTALYSRAVETAAPWGHPDVLPGLTKAVGARRADKIWRARGDYLPETQYATGSLWHAINVVTRGCRDLPPLHAVTRTSAAVQTLIDASALN